MKNKMYSKKTYLIVITSIIFLVICSGILYNFSGACTPYFVAPSPDGEKIIFGFLSWHRARKGSLSQLFIYSVRQKQFKYLGCAEEAYWSPNEEVVCFVPLSRPGKKSFLVMADLRSFPHLKSKKVIIHPSQKSEENIRLLGWSPKGNYLAFLKSMFKNTKEDRSQDSIIGQSIIIWGINDNSRKLIELGEKKINIDHISDFSVSWSPEEDAIFYIKEPSHELCSISIKEGIEEEIRELTGYKISAFFFQKDGSIIFFVHQPRSHGEPYSFSIFKRDIIAGKIEEIGTEISLYVFHSNDGRYVGVFSKGKGHKILVLDLQTKEKYDLNIELPYFRYPIWWYDNKFLFFIGTRLYSLNFQGKEFEQIFPAWEREHVFYFYRHLLFWGW